MFQKVSTLLLTTDILLTGGDQASIFCRLCRRVCRECRLNGVGNWRARRQHQSGSRYRRRHPNRHSRNLRQIEGDRQNQGSRQQSQTHARIRRGVESGTDLIWTCLNIMVVWLRPGKCCSQQKLTKSDPRIIIFLLDTKDAV